MTNKEAKDKLYLQWQAFLEDNIDYAGVSEAYKMAFKALEQEPKTEWIPVSERLPEKAGQYLVTIQSSFGVNSMEIANFSLDLSIVSCLFSNKKGKSGWWGCDDNGWNIFIYSCVIAWMPLPAPYKAESEEV